MVAVPVGSAATASRYLVADRDRRGPALGSAGEAQPGVTVARPAPADLGRVSLFSPVSTRAVADPDGGRSGVEAAVALAPAGADGHEAVVAFQGVRSLQQPVDPFGEQERCSPVPSDDRQRLVRAPVRQVVTAVDSVDRVEGRCRYRQPVERDELIAER